ncbi:hypothetical protein NLI96_g12558 [Meripilus lineatus]|uniref:Uncharacterized protein n=1 Tax=Meripilus lineatus TaxID=2056292 RepID=A0AAD5UPQ1_9APHY|nr:hypothetical protein NLI96_g12558 [Physisporinus lineatus]
MNNRHSNSEGNSNKRRRTVSPPPDRTPLSDPTAPRIPEGIPRPTASRGERQTPDNGAAGRHVDTTSRWVQSVRQLDQTPISGPPTIPWSRDPTPQQVDPLPWTYHSYYGVGHFPGHCPICDPFFRHMDADSELVSFQAAIAKRENHFNTRVEVARQNEASATAEINRLRQVILTLQAELKEIECKHDVGRERNLLLQQQVRILERDPSAMVVDPRDPPPTNQHTYDLDDRAQNSPHLRDDISSDDPLYEVFAEDWEETEEDREEVAQKAARNTARAQLRAQRRAMETPEKRECRLETRRVLRADHREREKEFPRSGKRIPKHLRGPRPLPESFWDRLRHPHTDDEARRMPPPEFPVEPRQLPGPYYEPPPVGHAPVAGPSRNTAPLEGRASLEGRLSSHASFYPMPQSGQRGTPGIGTPISGQGYIPGNMFASSFRGGRGNIGSSTTPTSAEEQPATPLQSRISEERPRVELPQSIRGWTSFDT